MQNVYIHVYMSVYVFSVCCLLYSLLEDTVVIRQNAAFEINFSVDLGWGGAAGLGENADKCN